MMDRQEARRRGFSRYFTGGECPQGHIADRYTTSGKCVECNKERCRRYREKILCHAHVIQYMKYLDSCKLADSHVSVYYDEIQRIEDKMHEQAILAGDVTYTSKKPCPHGHIGLRRIVSRGCYYCSNEIMRSQERKEYDREYYQKHVDRISIRSKVYYQNTKDARLKAQREWVVNNKDRVAVTKKNYKHRRRAWEFDGVSTAELREWIDEQPKRCFYCEVECDYTYHIDHVIPLSVGGEHELYNLRISCDRCNISKNRLDPIDFIVKYEYDRVMLRKEIEEIIEQSKDRTKSKYQTHLEDQYV